jgi:bifunctional UDP-N-acetylglucosamine pyrophosphorylase/glucosamine-1-phosphate N-acetyltransferase
MKAVILAAGKGSRMCPLTNSRPKVMLRILNEPLLEHLLLAAKSAGIRDFVFIIGYRHEQIRDYFKSGKKWGVRIEYRLQRQPKGTADALLKTKDIINDRFILMNGDVLTDADDLKRLVQSEGFVMTAIEKDDVSGLGVIEVAGKKVIRIHEKTASPPTKLVNSGFYAMTPAIFDALAATPISPRGEYELTDSLQLLIDKGEKVFFQKLNSWHSISYPWDLFEENRLFISSESNNHGTIEQNVSIQGPYTIGKDTVIRSGCYIVGPVVIGNNCDIGPNCYIRPLTTIEDHCHIGSAVEIKNSIIMRGTKIPHHNYVGDSIIGENCNLGAGTKIANLRFDNKNINPSNKRKMGALLGDNVSTGINSCIDAGTLIGDNTIVGPGAIAQGNISPDSKIF